MFRSPNVYPQGVRQALLKLPLYIVVNLARLDLFPEDGPLETETFRSFMEFLAF